LIKSSSWRALHEAIEAHDPDAAEAPLAEDVVFTSPVVLKPYYGRAITAAIMRGAARVFEEFRYVRAIDDVDGRAHALAVRRRARRLRRAPKIACCPAAPALR
jgi:hypothetical protein